MGIEVIGLGAGDIDQLPLGVYRKLKQAEKKIFARTLDHPVVQTLEQEGVSFHSLDYMYEKESQFEAVYEGIVDTLLNAAEEADIMYTVPGHPMLAERTVQLLLQQHHIPIHITGGQSYLDAMFTSLQIDPIEGLQFMDATSFTRDDLRYQQHIIFSQVYDAFVASEVKLTLLEDLPADYPVTIIEAAGTHKEKREIVPLEALDRMDGISNLTSVYIPPVPEELLTHTFPYLRTLIQVLRGPNGCPWDRKQTHISLRKYLLEETYELIDALEAEDDEAIIEELGDVLLQVMLHSQIGEDDGYFTIDDVIRTLVEKMIHRHPHVFGTEADVTSWDALKATEKSTRDSLLDGVIWQSSALEVATQLQAKTAKIGFDWEHTTDLWGKFEEEKQEFIEVLEKGETYEAELEFGDMLFVLANLARHSHIQPELALNRTSKKFHKCFTWMEKEANQQGASLDKMGFEALNDLWEQAKRKD